MLNFNLDLSKRGGKIKPMNAVNNGPTGGGVRQQKSNFDAYRELEIPYARNHDASASIHGTANLWAHAQFI